MDETIKKILDSINENEILAAISKYDELASETIEFLGQVIEAKTTLEKYAEEYFLD